MKKKRKLRRYAFKVFNYDVKIEIETNNVRNNTSCSH